MRTDENLDNMNELIASILLSDDFLKLDSSLNLQRFSWAYRGLESSDGGGAFSKSLQRCDHTYLWLCIHGTLTHAGAVSNIWKCTG